MFAPHCGLDGRVEKGEHVCGRNQLSIYFGSREDADGSGGREHHVGVVRVHELSEQHYAPGSRDLLPRDPRCRKQDAQPVAARSVARSINEVWSEATSYYNVLL